MKTLHLTNAWHERSGGIATFYKALFEAATRRRQFLRLVVPGAESRQEEWSEFVRIYYIQSPPAPFDRNYRLLMPHRYLLPGGALANILNAEQPDLVEVCDKWSMNYFAGMLRRGWAPGIPFRPTVVGLTCERMDDNWRTYFGNSRFGDWFCRAYMKWLYFPLFDHHIANSDHTAHELQPASRGHVQPRGVWIRPMGVDSERFDPSRRTSNKRSAILTRLGLPPETFLLLNVGRLAPEKNLKLLFDALAQALPHAPNVHLLMAGDGALFQELHTDASQRFPGHVTFLGHIADREYLGDLIANSDAFLHANPKEPFGIAPLEAMASGTPLIAPLTGGVRSYANPCNAWLAEPAPDQYAAAILDILHQPNQRAARTAAARATAEQFDWRRIGDIFLDLYAEIHAYRTGAKPQFALAPSFLSTSGNWLGQAK